MGLVAKALEEVAALVRKGLSEDVAERVVDGAISEEKGLQIMERRNNRQALRDEANRLRFGDPDTSYRGDHRAPDADYGAPLHDLTQMIPDDIYSSQGRRLYGLGQSDVDNEAFDVLNAVRGQPDAEVPMYRAVPEDAPDSILDGDWVPTSEEYARMHGENALNNEYKILTEPTYARRLQSEGYPYEFGYMEKGSATPGGLAAAGSTALIASLLAEDSEAGPLAKVISKTINRQDDANLPWSSEAQYTHDQSGGFMRLGIDPDGRVSTLELEVPEEFRRRGIGGELQELALRDYPEMQGQVSSKSALRNAYRLGRRPVEEPDATLERALEMQSQASSVNMKRPTSAERGAATPGMMALLGAGGAGATAAGSESNAVTRATNRIVNHMLDNVTEVTDLLEIPQRGIQGLLRAGYGLMQGDGLDASLNAGADVVNQGVEETARQAGDAMLEKTGNPELATMAYTAVMLGSPL